MGIKQLYNDNLRNLPNEYGDVSVMYNLKKITPLFCFKTHVLYIIFLKLFSLEQNIIVEMMIL